MHQRRFYALAFLFVLVAAVVGASLARSAVGPVSVPRLDVIDQVQDVLAGLDINALIPRRAPVPAQAQPTSEPTIRSDSVAPTAAPTIPVAGGLTPEPAETQSAPDLMPDQLTPAPTIQPTDTPVLLRPTATPAPATPTPTSPPAPVAFPFMPAGAVRHSTGDCSGPSIRGVVRDSSGNPLPAVRLWRYDQWGNQQTVDSKSGAADQGQYDFVLGDTPNIHYVQVVDGSGVPISPAVEVQHRQGEAQEATCHWLDWMRS